MRQGVKHQYFGDENDFLKYGILRGLVQNDVRLLVAWMLTHDDGRTDGKFIDYLHHPKRWRHHDPDLFDFLKQVSDTGAVRSTRPMESWSGLGGTYLTSIVPDDRRGRSEWTEYLVRNLDGHQLAFFDPDNGIEIP